MLVVGYDFDMGWPHLAMIDRYTPGSWRMEGTPIDVWSVLFGFFLVMAMVLGLAFARTRRVMFRKGAVGLALLTAGTGMYLIGGGEIVATVVSMVGALVILTSGMIRPSC
jgi:hypothetical protein